MKRMISLLSISVFLQLLAFQIQEAHSSASYKLVATIPVGGSLVDIAVISKANEIYAVNLGNYEINVIDGTTRRIKASIPAVAPARINIDSEKERLLIGSTIKDLIVFELPTLKELKTIDMVQAKDEPISRKFPSINRSSNKIYFGSHQGKLFVLDTLSYELIKQIPLEVSSFPTSLSVNPTLNEIYLADSFQSRVIVIDGNRDVVSLSIPIEGPKGISWNIPPVREIAFNDTNNEIYVGHILDAGTKKGAISVIDVSPVVGPSTYKVVKTIELPGYPFSVAVNKLRNEVYVALQITNAIAVIDIPTRKLVTTIPLEIPLDIPVWAIDIDENRGLIYATGGGVVKVISITEEPIEPTLTLTGHTDAVDSIAFSPKGDLLVSGGNWDPNGIRLWDLKTGKTIRTFPNPQPVLSVVFSPDGSRFVSASFDHTAKLWDVANGNLIWTYTDTTFQNQLNWVDFSPNNPLEYMLAKGERYIGMGRMKREKQ